MTDLYWVRPEEIEEIGIEGEVSFHCSNYAFEIKSASRVILATFLSGESEGGRVVIPYHAIAYMELSPVGMDVKGQPL